jgi:hypothetical protein
MLGAPKIMDPIEIIECLPNMVSRYLTEGARRNGHDMIKSYPLSRSIEKAGKQPPREINDNLQPA